MCVFMFTHTHMKPYYCPIQPYACFIRLCTRCFAPGGRPLRSAGKTLCSRQCRATIQPYCLSFLLHQDTTQKTNNTNRHLLLINPGALEIIQTRKTSKKLDVHCFLLGGVGAVSVTTSFCFRAPPPPQKKKQSLLKGGLLTDPLGSELGGD